MVIYKGIVQALGKQQRNQCCEIKCKITVGGTKGVTTKHERRSECYCSEVLHTLVTNVTSLQIEDKFPEEYYMEL